MKAQVIWIRAILLLAAAVVSHESIAGGLYNPECGEGRYILTPPEPAEPRIHGPSVFGVRPGSPFLFTIPATGQRPMEFSVEELPAGLTVNRTSGVISGTMTSGEKGNCEVTLVARNALGVTRKPFRIVAGDEICLTPPLGWNSWNCWGHQVDQEKVLASAQAMAAKGLKDYGWTYINIDDAWQGERGGKYNGIQGHPEKFPDIAAMCDAVHALGLKVGIYSSPWITTYAGFVGGSSDDEDGAWDREKMAGNRETKKAHQRHGRYPFDENDAKQWAEWGIDYLKYDWNPNDPECTVRMAAALKNCGRDIVYSLSNTAPLKYAELFGREANCWRTAGDLKDRWDQEGAHLNIIEQWELHRDWIEEGVRGGPGHFPDPDMLVVGDVIESNKGHTPRPSRLTPDEQYAHISLWTLWSAPMLIGCPIETMDEFTLKLLTNPGVLSIHQDARAIPGRSVVVKSDYEIIVKELADGGKAIGLFNKDDKAQTITADWKKTGLKGRHRLRDVWRQKDIGTYNGTFTANVPSHGVVLVRMAPDR